MNDNEFYVRCAARREENASSSAENRARVELLNIKLSELRRTHACIIRLSRSRADEVLRAALAADVLQGLAKHHTNSLGVTIFKYNKI